MVSSIDVVPTDPIRSSVLPQHVRHALAYLRANLREKVTLADLALACGISERTLLEQFRRFLGVSPIAHLFRMRLAAARAELQESDGTISVSEVASRCGVTHAGRFAIEYRKAFGERPSTTLRRARRSPDKNATSPGTTCATNGDPASLHIPFVARQRPSLMILPLRTETLQERRAAQETIEQVAASLSRASVASVTFADPTVVVSRRTVRSPTEHAATQYCLHGRLVQRGDRIRITLWLMDTLGRHVWGDSYDGATDGMFDLLQRVVDGAVCGVVPGITGAEIERLHGKSPESLAAREMMMQVFPLWLKIDAESARKVLGVASRAMEMDPDDALPVAMAAYSQLRVFLDGAPASPADALRLAHRAGTLDGGDPLVTTARAAIATMLQPREEAEALVERALAMDPTSGWAWERKGLLLSQAKPEQAIAFMRRAMQLHGPFMPRENCLVGIYQAHESAGRFDEAARWARRALAENSRAMLCHRALICYEERLGHHALARQLADELRRAHPEFRVSAFAQAFPGLCFDSLVRAGVPL